MKRAVASLVAIVLALAAGRALAAPTAPAGSGSGMASAPAAPVQLSLEDSLPTVSAAASPSALPLGAPFTIYVTVDFDPGVEVNLREPIELGGAFEVRRRDSRDTAAADGRHRREYQLEAVAWELGDLQIPPIAVTFTAGGHAGQVETNAVPMRIEGSLGAVDDNTAMRGDAPPITVLARDWFWLEVAGVAAIVIALAAFGLTARRRRRKRTLELTGGLVATTRRLDTPGEHALARLLAIDHSGALDADDQRRAGYDDMVDVIREYVGARYSVATRDLTSAELARRLEPVAPAGERVQVEAWLARCDVVRYGGHRAQSADARGVLADARALVLATTAPGAVARRSREQPATREPGASEQIGASEAPS